MLMMLQPIALAEFRAKVWFSWMVNTFNFPLLMALSSMVLGTEALINLLQSRDEGEEGGRDEERRNGGMEE